MFKWLPIPQRTHSLIALHAIITIPDTCCPRMHACVYHVPSDTWVIPPIDQLSCETDSQVQELRHVSHMRLKRSTHDLREEGEILVHHRATQMWLNLKLEWLRFTGSKYCGSHQQVNSRKFDYTWNSETTWLINKNPTQSKFTHSITYVFFARYMTTMIPALDSTSQSNFGLKFFAFCYFANIWQLAENYWCTKALCEASRSSCLTSRTTCVCACPWSSFRVTDLFMGWCVLLSCQNSAIYCSIVWSYFGFLE